jgi:hypothetical protein
MPACGMNFGAEKLADEPAKEKCGVGLQFLKS